MKKLGILLILGLTVLAGAAEMKLADLPMKEFLQRARRRNSVATYAMLDGTLQHRRRGQDAISMPVYFGAIIHPDRTFGQLILDGDEGYTLSQSAGSGVTSMTPMTRKPAGTSKLDHAGVQADDLVLSFLFCPPLRELERETIRGIVPCRVFLLDNKAKKETVKVWISCEHAFPFRAEFIKYGEDEPYRDLEAGALTKKNDLYYIRQIQLSGPGWMTKIDFEEKYASVGLHDEKSPAPVFRQLGK